MTPNIVVTDKQVIVNGVPVPGIIGEDIRILPHKRDEVGRVVIELFYEKVICERHTPDVDGRLVVGGPWESDEFADVATRE